MIKLVIKSNDLKFSYTQFVLGKPQIKKKKKKKKSAGNHWNPVSRTRKAARVDVYAFVFRRLLKL